MSQTWHDLLFAHWPIEPKILRPLVPAKLPLDEFDGKCWVGVVPFRMSGVRLRGTPAIPLLSAFPELNVRTYVKLQNRPGVYFFSLDATSLPAVKTARALYKLPYFHARMSCREINGEIIYNSQRLASRAELRGRYRPIGPVQLAEPATLKHWLTERYCLYTVRNQRVYRADVHHQPWPLQDAEAQIETNSMAEAAAIKLPAVDPVLYFAKKLEVIVWPLRPVE
jgi:uncharacterized protein YqjF (DUF2071 family)